MDSQFVKPPPIIPHDIFHVYILPNLLSEHLHKLLVVHDAPNWHAFYTLPLVSSAFRETCQVLYARIFGSERGSDIDRILTFTQLLWHQAEFPSAGSQLLSQCTDQELMSGDSLIQVYICTAVSRSFLRLDISFMFSRGSLRGNSEAQRRERHLETSNDNPETRRGLRLVDDWMHRVYLPFSCAITHCDSVRPERLAYVAASYLAELMPVFSTAPVLLKYAQDLEIYVTREHRVDLENWSSWTLQTLELVRTTKHLLKAIHRIGTLVQSFSTVLEIPMEVLEATNIIKAVHDVKSAYWGTCTSEIRARASSLLQEWGISE